MSHAGFIAVAYLLAAVVLIILVAWIVMDGRAQKRRLAQLESLGIRRRSAGKETS